MIVPVKTSLFISYSHVDDGFASDLAVKLVQRGKDVWIAKWDIRVGDSLQQKIEEGISNASYLAVILSKSSVESAWVKAELRAALVRELSESKTFVLPLLIEDCEIPLFLRDKKYIDFRGGMDSGIDELVRRLDPPDVGTHGRVRDAEFLNDYTFRWALEAERHHCEILAFSHGPDIPFSIFTHINFEANEVLEERMRGYDVAGLSWASFVMMIESIRSILPQIDTRVLIDGDQAAILHAGFRDPERDIELLIEVSAMRLGPGTGRDIVYDWGPVVEFAADEHKKGIVSAIPRTEWNRFYLWIQENRLPRSARA